VDDPLSLVPAGQDQFAYQQVNDYVDSRGTEINAVFRWDSMKFFLGYTHADVREHSRARLSLPRSLRQWRKGMRRTGRTFQSLSLPTGFGEQTFRRFRSVVFNGRSWRGRRRYRTWQS